MDKSHLAPGAYTQHSHSGPASHTPAHDDLRPASIMMAANNDSRRTPRKLVLCFDGTGNKFKGDDSDSNILKIFRALDRTVGDQYHYYQPGIGTYVISKSLSHTSHYERLRSWYMKAKDSAIGTSFDQHVVSGYRFLMRFYCPGDEIYLFGFSRGSYVARFLAEMLDYVGLLTHGNEEMVIFAWKAFSHWQSRRADNSPEGTAKKKEMYRYMKGFRDTFSRPVKRIRFLGLFDTVNSVPRFETAWMQRSKFPYTAKTSAKVIRHCVSIDERRAKFRQDLIYQGAGKDKRHGHTHEKLHDFGERFRGTKQSGHGPTAGGEGSKDQFRGRHDTLVPPEEEMVFRPSHSRSRSRTTQASQDGVSEISGSHIDFEYDSDSDDEEQDIDEIWFAGGHGDVGGGWEDSLVTKAASHVPLVYMIREAQKAGLGFDPEKLAAMDCIARAEAGDPDVTNKDSAGTLQGDGTDGPSPGIQINITDPSPVTSPGPELKVNSNDWAGYRMDHPKEDEKKEEEEKDKDEEHTNPFHDMLHKAHLARIHDSLQFKSGLGKGQVIAWNIMEYLPFRRMDLRGDGSWEPISWPLPMGEVRDVPLTARVHGSVIRRLKQDESYRPGNLIIGGGGRGVRHAPKDYGIGEWECVQEEGDPIGEVWVRKNSAAPSSPA